MIIEDWMLCGGSLDSAAAHLPEEETSDVEWWHRNRAPAPEEVRVAAFDWLVFGQPYASVKATP